MKLRVYVDCQSPYTNRIKYYLRKDGDVATQKVTTDFSLVAGVWNEVTIDLSKVTGTGTVFNNSLFLFDAGVDPDADGDIYYLDAFQAPAAYSFPPLSVDDFELSRTKLEAYPNPVNNTLKLNKTFISAKVYNMIAQLINEYKTENSIVVSGYTKGI